MPRVDTEQSDRIDSKIHADLTVTAGEGRVRAEDKDTGETETYGNSTGMTGCKRSLFKLELRHVYCSEDSPLEYCQVPVEWRKCGAIVAGIARGDAGWMFRLTVRAVSSEGPVA